MAKEQTRSSMSISGKLYREFQAVCQGRCQSVSSAVSELIEAHIAALRSKPTTATRLARIERAQLDLDRRVTALEPADYRPKFEGVPF